MAATENQTDPNTDSITDDQKVEWCFPVPRDGGMGEIRIRTNGEVVWTGGDRPVEWAILDGISFPTAGFIPMPLVRGDVIRIDDLDSSLDGTDLAGSRYLYHYTKAGTALKSILPNRQLRLSPYSDVNDPREAKEWLFTVVSPEGAMRPGQSIEIGADMSGRIKGKSRVLCFCSDGFPLRREPRDVELHDTLGWTHPNMWAHYAEKHRGVVLVFHRQRLLTNSILRLRSKGRLHFGNVLYAPIDHHSGTTTLIIEYRSWAGRPPEESAVEHLERHRGWLFFTKHTAWAPEQECRLVAFGNVDEYEYIPIDGALSEIIVGEGADVETINCCRAFGIEFGVPVSRMFWRNGLPLRVPSN
jgi:hypothetical protein